MKNKAWHMNYLLKNGEIVGAHITTDYVRPYKNKYKGIEILFKSTSVMKLRRYKEELIETGYFKHE